MKLPSHRAPLALRRCSFLPTVLAAAAMVSAVPLSAGGGLGATANAATQTSTPAGLIPTCLPGQAIGGVVAVLAQSSPTVAATQQARTAAISHVLVAAQSAQSRSIADHIAPSAAGGQLAANLTLIGTNHLFRQTSLACATAAARTALDWLAATDGPVGADVLAGLGGER